MSSIKSKESFYQKSIVVLAVTLICCFLWGSAFPCVKIGYQMMGIESADTSSQILYAGLRFTLAGILAVIFGSITARKFLVPRVRIIPKITALAMLQTVIQYLFFYMGLARTSGVNASIVEAMNVFVAIVISAFLFRMEKISARKIIGCLIGFAGVVLICTGGKGLDMGFSFTGEGFIFLSTVAYAFSSVFFKIFARNENAALMSGYQFIIGGIIMIIIGAATGGKVAAFTTSSALMLLWLAIISSAAYTLWGVLLKYNPVSRIAALGFMNPVFGVILSAIFLGEYSSLGIAAVISLVLVCIGIYISNSVKKSTL